ncbi:hypothetical protein SCP_1303580 [Sparassis crispa]|uniref:3'-5' exonuclease n=1 Tax=Sparassis crispa TaxID=139825 RepID=A0A401H2C4_9APHY|nr:hypothetical protein SCP_1303580 [Sparassis crispa]GBE88542.1 hypothetical protein SCP_1303580 [Sparassis crispa]
MENEERDEYDEYFWEFDYDSVEAVTPRLQLTSKNVQMELVPSKSANNFDAQKQNNAHQRSLSLPRNAAVIRPSAPPVSRSNSTRRSSDEPQNARLRSLSLPRSTAAVRPSAPISQSDGTRRSSDEPQNEKRAVRANTTSTAGSVVVTRKRGRPKGTGHKQLARKAAEEAGEVSEEPIRRGRGRPRKNLQLVASSVRVEVIQDKIHIRGTPGTTASTLQHKNAPTIVSVPPIIDNQDDLSLAPGHNTQSPTDVTQPVDISSNCEPLDPPPAIRYVLPEEDPTRPVDGVADEEAVDGDGYIGLVMDGLGQEDDVPVEDEEADPGEVNAGDSPTAPKSKRRALPSWLMREFNEKVTEARQRGDSDKLPALYRSGTFWFPQKSRYFTLRSNKVSPQDLYSPQFFLWDPLPLTPHGIPCPKCKTKLYRDGHVLYPRRVVDFDKAFWIIGYRYRCPSCIFPKSGKTGNITFRSWDSRILAQLPPDLCAEFPAYLSRRSGMSQQVFQFMRSCFQNGMGAKQFSDTLRVQHLRHYDLMQLQYLQFLQGHRALGEWLGDRTFAPFLPFDDTSLDGYHGFVPSSQWLRNMYDQFMEGHEHDINQHTSMLTAEICAIDHSHKITKHVLKMNGVEIYCGLLTVTNERGEIRVCNLVATKAHSQFELALVRMRESLELYGHRQPTLFYTDNMADKQFLETSFPSLRENVIPVEKYAHLDQLVIPSHVNVYVKETADAIQQAILTIIDQVDENNPITVGFDAEWNVDLAEAGQSHGRARTAIIQIAFGNQVYILKIGQILAAGAFPTSLQSFLSSHHIRKVGRLVDVDLCHLEMETHSSMPFTGGFDLAKMAKERHVVSSAQVSLSDLCAIVLQKCLDKSVPERVSMTWENVTLTQEQIKYAALDAYASLRIYEELQKVPAPGPLPLNPLPSLPVLLYHTDNTRLIAKGIISHYASKDKYDEINLTSKRTVIQVDEVLVPGAIIGTHHKRALTDFGSPPFDLVCLRSHLRTRQSDLITSEASPSGSPPSVISSAAENNSRHFDALSDGPVTGSHCSEDESVSQDNLEGIGPAVLDCEEAEPVPWDSDISGIDRDQDSEATGKAILDALPSQWDLPIRSRVLKDPFHVFNMLYIPKTHGL